VKKAKVPLLEVDLHQEVPLLDLRPQAPLSQGHRPAHLFQVGDQRRKQIKRRNNSLHI